MMRRIWYYIEPVSDFDGTDDVSSPKHPINNKIRYDTLQFRFLIGDGRVNKIPQVGENREKIVLVIVLE
jgi:hypothetical protein